MDSGIYKITHRESGKCYVGSSYVIQRRWNRHKRELRANKHPNARLQNAWNKYGEYAFDFIVIEHVAENLVIEREQHWIDILGCVSNGYNIMPNAANRAGYIPDAETRAKMAAAKRGIPRSAETRAKISAYQKTRPRLPAESIQRASEKRRGTKHSDEARAKMSLAAKNRPPQSLETRAKRSAALKATLAAKRASQ